MELETQKMKVNLAHKHVTIFISSNSPPTVQKHENSAIYLNITIIFADKGSLKFLKNEAH